MEDCAETIINLVSPLNGATGVAINAELSWSGSYRSCSVYRGGTQVYSGAGTSVSQSLANNTTYSWYIVLSTSYATCVATVATSETWSFTTILLCTTPTITLSSPGNAATGVAINALLSWSGSYTSCMSYLLSL